MLILLKTRGESDVSTNTMPSSFNDVSTSTDVTPIESLSAELKQVTGIINIQIIKVCFSRNSSNLATSIPKLFNQ